MVEDPLLGKGKTPVQLSRLVHSIPSPCLEADVTPMVLL
jgi:hypothetical protein